MKRIVLVLVALAAVLAFAPASVQAQSYDPSQPQTLSTPGSVLPGQTFTLTAGNFCPGALVTFRIGGTIVGTATAGANGVASISTTAPASPGTYTTTATSTTPCAFTATASLGVVAPTATTVPGGLPPTGSQPINLVRTGGVALLIGLGLIGATRLRRRSQAA